jgi:hypothetical protein
MIAMRGCGNVAVVRQVIRPDVTVKFPAGPVAHLLRPGLLTEQDALLQRRRQRHSVIVNTGLDLREEHVPPMSHGSHFRTRP